MLIKSRWTQSTPTPHICLLELCNSARRQSVLFCYSVFCTAEVSLAAKMTVTPLRIFYVTVLDAAAVFARGTCASERAALGGGGGGGGRGRLVPLRHALQQVVETPKAARQVAQEALLPGAVLGRQAAAAHVGGWVGRRVTAGVAQGLVWMGTLSMTENRGEKKRRCHVYTVTQFVFIVTKFWEI